MLATITDKRRSEEFRKGETLKQQMTALDEARAIAKELQRLQQKPDASAGCRFDTNPVEDALTDLSSPRRVDVMAVEAVKIPF